jgi:carbon starvation protein CstA
MKFLYALTLVFITLKLMGYIAWGWLWVLIIPIGHISIVAVYALYSALLAVHEEYVKRNNK